MILWYYIYDNTFEDSKKIYANAKHSHADVTLFHDQVNWLHNFLI